MKDEVLTNLYALSKDAQKVWVKAGQPSTGPEFDEMCRLRREVRQRVRFSAGKTERLRIRRRHRMFAIGHRCRFKSPIKN